jgi:hypothetical protein
MHIVVYLGELPNSNDVNIQLVCASDTVCSYERQGVGQKEKSNFLSISSEGDEDLATSSLSLSFHDLFLFFKDGTWRR